MHLVRLWRFGQRLEPAACAVKKAVMGFHLRKAFNRLLCHRGGGDGACIHT